MAEMRYGLLLPNQGVVFGAVTVPELMEMAEQADGGGVFDTVFVGDNLLAKPRLESITLLSALAGRTRRVRLGTACMASFPLRDPIVLAAQWGALDNISEGRSLLVACIGGGGATGGAQAFHNEFRSFRIPTGERVSRLVEGMQVLRTLWSQDPASHHGEHFDFEGIAVRPRPVQQPCPIWIANNPHNFGPESRTFQRAAERTGAYADGWMTNGTTPAQFRTGWEAIRAAAAAHGRDPTALESSLYYNVNVGEPEAAYAESKRFLDDYYSTDLSREYVEVTTAFGSPQDCAEKIIEFREAGVQLLCIRFTSYDQLPQMRRFVEEVAPLLS